MDISWKAVDMISRIYREYYIENEEALVRNLLEEIGYDFDEEEDNVYDAFELIEEVIRNEATLVYGDDKVEVYEMDDVRFVYRIDSYGEKVGVACWKDYPTILGNGNEGSNE
jgi:hypothetical protein